MNTRDALLDCAERAARARGYDGFSYADLADEIGIRKASIHHHFPTKADLALELMRRYRASVFETLQRLAADEPRGSGRIRGFLAVYRAALGGGQSACLCVMFSAGREALSDPVLAELNRFHTDALAWLADAFARARDDGSIADLAAPEAEAAACLALVEGAQLMARAATRVELFDAAVARLQGRLG
ncbi:TetR/AcrR family transcriptional regulator [Limibaculum sp. FT325]|uniref:TetR/AcrR family transcriptional regulator n=1 Tax=Thermohalobaculum sediminis TaxID=2939436 RepID=UPI0020BF020F|nr:TetR/AcrR family transcriptional regulator [Limibaculum sediminis]MCL5777697.1 TetR/AcrR family transcriptional regulator [Limibaculum sediminis]